MVELHTHIQWVRGQDVDDEIPNNDTFEDRYSFYDPLHSSAVAFTVGGDNAMPVVKVVVGTNDGGIRLINGHNGIEEFIFYPQTTLKRLPVLRNNPAGPHGYGIDGTATVWLNDVDNNGVIEVSNGDFARIIIGQRRGGNKNIFAGSYARTGTGPQRPRPGRHYRSHLPVAHSRRWHGLSPASGRPGRGRGSPPSGWPIPPTLVM